MSATRLFIASLCLVALPLEALAERGGNGKGGDRGNSSSAHADRDSRSSDRGNRGNGRKGGDSTLNAANGNSANARANPSQGFCPPGLREQEQGCVPAGEAAAGVTGEDWGAQQGYRYVPGAQLEDGEYALLPNHADFGLPDLPEGEAYAVVNRTAIVIDPATGTMLRVATR